ncbi:MAG: translation initiation factor IF-2 [Chloroflexi bacterium]|nr:MAG: translation initiation factor IF-2 [Chloroflexota bacterium]
MTTDTAPQVEIPRTLTVKELADMLDQTPIGVIKVLMTNGVMAEVTKTIDYDTAAIVAVDLGFEPIEGAADVVEEPQTTAQADLYAEAPDPDDSLAPRPPIVAVLGHVDHGKTTLLDAIRQTNITEGEAGGITQHIGAYQATLNDKPITFLDTPGHEAFTAMRARGAQATDIAILVVAANDGVMPQTKEAIDHIRAAGVPLIVALNKIDVDNINIDRVKSQLSDAQVMIEEYGGDVPLVPVSGTTKQGLDDLLETILLVAEVQANKANAQRTAAGIVLEAELDRRQGSRTTLLVQRGTLNQGDSLLVGGTWGRVKAMFDFNGERIKTAGPSTPVSILGVQDLATAGDHFRAVTDDKSAKRLYEQAKRAREAVEAQRQHAASLDALFGEISKGEVKELNLVLKTDVDGSVEPLRLSLERLTNDEVHVKVIHAAPGAITESDVNLAAAAKGIVLGFQVGTEPGAHKLAVAEAIEIRRYDIIYGLIEEVEAAVSGMLEPVDVDIVDAHAEVLQVFPIRRIGNIAGSRCDDGSIRPDLMVRVLRAADQVASGKIRSLRRFQEEAREVTVGQEFGVAIEGYEDFQTGDKLEFYHTERKSRIVRGGRVETA